ncbi:hypothetical protein OROGR_030873 [Orobanche gracilis]
MIHLLHLFQQYCTMMLINQISIPLSEIDVKTRNKTVIVKILCVWIKKDTKKNEGLELILVDEWCNRIQATISVGLREKLMSSLMEGVVAIKKFQRIPNNPKYQNAKVNHESMINFGFATKVQPQEGSYMKDNSFDFIRFGDIPTRNISFIYSWEVKIEQIEIEHVEMKNDTNATKCDVLLEDADGTQVTCVMWGTFAEQLKSFIENKSSDDNEPVIVALQFVMISKFRGTKVQTMKHCTKLFIRPDIQEVKDFIKRRVVTRSSSSFTTTNISIGSRDKNRENWLDATCAITLHDLISSTKGTFVCKATIADFQTEEPWYYKACAAKGCFKGIERGGKVGDHCIKLGVKTRYCLKALVEDDIESAYFTLFEECATLLLRKTAVQLLKEMEQQSGSSRYEVEETKEFAEWILKVGDGTIGDMITDGEAILSDEIFKDRAILAPTNDMFDEINNYVMLQMSSNERTYLSSDSICKEDGEINLDDDVYSVEYLNTIKCSGLPSHEIKLKKGCIIMLLRNIDPSNEMCNGTRIIVTKLGIA